MLTLNDIRTHKDERVIRPGDGTEHARVCDAQDGIHRFAFVTTHDGAALFHCVWCLEMAWSRIPLPPC